MGLIATPLLQSGSGLSPGEAARNYPMCPPRLRTFRVALVDRNIVDRKVTAADRIAAVLNGSISNAARPTPMSLDRQDGGGTASGIENSGGQRS